MAAVVFQPEFGVAAAGPLLLFYTLSLVFMSEWLLDSLKLAITSLVIDRAFHRRDPGRCAGFAVFVLYPL